MQGLITPSSHLVPHPEVVTLAHSTGAILFHLAEDRILALNRSAADLWGMLCQGICLDELATLWQQRTPQALESRRLQDLEAILTSLVNQRYLIQAGDTPEETHGAGSILCQALCWLLHQRWPFASSDWAIRLEARKTQRWIQQLLRVRRDGLLLQMRWLAAVPTRRCIGAQDPLLHQLRAAIATTARHLPFRSRCLHQSLALCWLLARRGIESDFVLGAYTHPLSLHAWVESGGQVIQWEAGLGKTPDPMLLAAMSVVMHSRRVRTCLPEQGVPV